MNMPLVTSHAGSKPLLPFTAAKLSKDQQTSVGFPFKFSSNLSEHALFQLPRLAELVHYVASQTPDKVTCIVRGRTRDCNWPQQIDCERAAELVSQAEETSLLILIKDAQRDPEYRALLDEIVDELEKLTEQPLRQKHTCFETYIFIAPSSFQNCYLEFESSFLFLLHEEKKISWQDKDHSIFISLISLPGENRTVSVNLFALKPAPIPIVLENICKSELSPK